MHIVVAIGLVVAEGLDAGEVLEPLAERVLRCGCEQRQKKDQAKPE
jgi:hypothetical protein